MSGEALSRKIGYAFQQPALLRQALIHRSHSTPHNERLEFLGDSVLNCCIAHDLFRLFPQLPEGDLSRLRASLVNQQTLFELAQKLGLGKEMLFGEGELKSGGDQRPSILADAFEAILGAVFLDGGFEKAQQVAHQLFAPLLEHIDPKLPGKDPKTLLQEYLQGRKLALPQYQVTATCGEAHEQIFEVECLIPALRIRASGQGGSRRSAEQNAAKAAYQLACRPDQ